MLMEQLALAHHVVGRLHVQAGTNTNVPAVQMLHAAAARLMGEFRRTALALQAYRQRPTYTHAEAPPPTKDELRDKLQTGGNGHAAATANGHARRRVSGRKTPSDGELGSNRLRQYFHDTEPALT